VFERFTESGRQVVALAQVEARALEHNYIGTEHILLALLREQEGLAAQVLGGIGISFDGVRTQVVRIIGEGEKGTPGQIPFTPRAIEVLNRSQREMIALQPPAFIGTEHLLLGLVSVEDGVAAEILKGLGADPETIRAEVRRALGH
jgi:ATP-dependent Clp protease ATP-binding subunit ClpC